MKLRYKGWKWFGLVITTEELLKESEVIDENE